MGPSLLPFIFSSPIIWLLPQWLTPMDTQFPFLIWDSADPESNGNSLCWQQWHSFSLLFCFFLLLIKQVLFNLVYWFLFLCLPPINPYSLPEFQHQASFSLFSTLSNFIHIYTHTPVMLRYRCTAPISFTFKYLLSLTSCHKNPLNLTTFKT